jgi:GH15 family glucan-1,4-alpha-glucosidase
LVASIYKNILSENNECLLFVRAEEDDNNHYLQTLKNSEIWDVYCGNETYKQIETYSGFDLASWIATNIKWEKDLDQDTLAHFNENDLVKYLLW